MTRSSRRRRVLTIICALALAVTACSVEIPVEFVGEGGPAAPEDAATAQAGGATTGIAEAAGPAGVSAQSVSAQEAESCRGAATDVGVSGNRILLGSTFAVSGPVSSISGPILKGVQAYFNKVNAEGGVNGRKVALKWYDDGWDAQRGRAYIKRLVEQDKVFVLSVVPSSNGLDAARSYLEQKGVPVFGTSGLIDSQFESSMQWPIGTSTKSIVRTSLLYMKREKVRNLAVIWLDLLAGRESIEAYQNGIEPIMGKDPDEFLVNPNGYRVSISEPDFGPVWTRIMDDTRRWQAAHGQPTDGRPDFVGFAIDPTNAIKALQAAENIGFRPTVGWGGGPPLFLDLVPQSTDYAAETGLLASTSYLPPVGRFLDLPAVRDYVQTVRRYYGDDVDVKNPYLEGGYAGAALTVEVLKRAGPCLTRERVLAAANGIRGFSAAGLTRPLTYLPFGRGQSHFGNISQLTLQVTRGNRWRIVGDWVRDPLPGHE